MSSSSRLAVLVFTDLVGSTELKVRIGAGFTPLLERHNALFEKACAEFHGEVLKHTGDGYFAAFPIASDAVRAALSFQSAMRLEPWPHPMLSRVGIHVGEVASLNMAGRADVSGVAADLAARVMALAAGSQILLTRSVFNDARQFVAEHPAVDVAPAPALQWIAHGSYLFDGIEEPQEVFEVGGVGAAPLIAPLGGEKARRVVPHDQEQTLGWRPAVGLTIEGRAGWFLERKLGEGGFGEVWLGKHVRTKQQRVFKFCFDAERLRSFKRELTLFRLLRDALGDRSDIAKLYEVKLDQPPFFLESEYTNGGNLAEWAEREGGLDHVALERRLDIVVQVADTVAAAHSIGVMHKDIKPSNVLIQVESHGRIQPRLSDFGIGFLEDKSQLAARHITEAGFTAVTSNESSRTGTRMYAPPEVLAGRPFTTQGDVYALGILLYEMVVADLNRPLAAGWERDIDDELLREDISKCVDGDPARRLGSASELAERLRRLEQRRSQAAAIAAKSAHELRWHRTARIASFVVLICMLLLATGGITAAIYIVKLKNANNALAMQRNEAQKQKSIAEEAAAKSAAVAQFVTSMLEDANPRQSKGEATTVREVLDAAVIALDSAVLRKQPAVESAVRKTISKTYQELGMLKPAEQQIRKALEIDLRLLPTTDAELPTVWMNLGVVLDREGNPSGAEDAYRRALMIIRQASPPRRASHITSLFDLAIVMRHQGKLSEAEPLYSEALQVLDKVNPADRRECGEAFYEAGWLFFERDLSRAEMFFRKSLQSRRKFLAADHIDVTTTLNALALTLQNEKKWNEAEATFQQAITLIRSARPLRSGGLAVSLSNLATLFEGEGKLAQAEEAYREVIDIRRQALAPSAPQLVHSLNELANLLQRQGRIPEANQLLKEAADREAIAQSSNSGPTAAPTTESAGP